MYMLKQYFPIKEKKSKKDKEAKFCLLIEAWRPANSWGVFSIPFEIRPDLFLFFFFFFLPPPFGSFSLK